MAKLASYCAPAGQSDPMADVLRECAQKMHIALPAPVQAEIASLGFEELDEMKPMARFNEGSAVEDMTVDLVVGVQPQQVPVTVFECLNNNGVVFDGRVVVDSALCTSDPFIYAAGEEGAHCIDLLV